MIDSYRNTFIAVADDCPAETGIVPPRRPAAPPSAAGIQHTLLVEQPYAHTEPDILFESATIGRESVDLPPVERLALRAAFFARPQPCLRASPLAKRYGWGIHFDSEGRAAAYPVGSPDYQRLSTDPNLQHTRAMRSQRA